MNSGIAREKWSLFQAGQERKPCKISIKQTVRLFRHQITLTKKHFNDLSVNESEAYGLDFSQTMHDF